MANSYTTVPAIIPGNLTVSGNLLVKGGQFAMGKYPRMYRIQELGNGQFVETVNLDKVVPAQDDATVQSLLRGIMPMGEPFQIATQLPGSPATDSWWIVLSSTALQVAGPELRVGNAPPYSRLLKNGSITALTANLQSDLTTRDLTANSGYSWQIDSSNQSASYRIINPAGTIYGASAPLCLWSDYSVHTTTGVTGTTTVASRLLRANAMGPNSALLLTICGKGTVAAGGQINLYAGLGSLSIYFWGLPANTSGPFRATAIIANQNNSAIQNASAEITYNQTLFCNAIAPGAVDTTQDQLMSIFHVTSNAPDSSTIYAIEAHILNTWGPI